MVTRPYPIFELEAVSEPRRTRSAETMGTKEKFWLENPQSGQRVMVKLAREGTGEDWSEKLAFEIGKRCSVSCARIDLARVAGRPAVLCWDFLPRRRRLQGADPSLIHGNELLLRRDADYPAEQRYRVLKHTLPAIMEVLEGCGPARARRGFAFGKDAFDSFVGYLMLDALIGNTDRHHENWAVVSTRGPNGHRLALAPSYDHASSLGRELDDVKRQGRLDSSGRGTLPEYVKRGHSALYGQDGAKLTPFDALLEAGRLRPGAFAGWQTLFARATFDLLSAELEAVPASRLSAVGKRFTRELLRYNYDRIVHAQL